MDSYFMFGVKWAKLEPSPDYRQSSRTIAGLPPQQYKNLSPQLIFWEKALGHHDP